MHDYHLLLAPKMIRESLGQIQHPGDFATTTPSPAALGDSRNGMDWETQKSTSTVTASAEKDETRLEKLGGFLSNAGSSLGYQLGLHDHKDQGEIMIGMFMHTPWPSSEIFRCLPSKMSATI